MTRACRMVAIGIDAAEPSLVRTLIDAGRMPVLASLVRDGAWKRVTSPSNVGSGAVWPTFITGRGPLTHGVYAEWAWQPASMSVARYHGRQLAPFWKAIADGGPAVGMFDVPFAPLIGLTQGYEVSEWGPHDAFEGHATAAPAAAATLLAAAPPHPYYGPALDPTGPDDRATLERLAAASLTGVRARGDLVRALNRESRPDVVIAAFTEIHHASHYLWQTVAADHPLYDGLTTTPGGSPLTALYQEVDRQIGAILDDAGAAAALVFSLHGMRAARGVAAFLGPLLCERGFATRASWRTQTWRERGVGAFAAIKRRTPPVLKRIYYRTVPSETVRQLARPTMLPAYDWSRTRAFALPSDQHGWVRVNLRGREAAGIVEEADYASVLDEIEAFVGSLTDEAKRPLMLRTFRPARTPDEARGSMLPDLVVHWRDAALARNLRIRGSRVSGAPIGQKFTSQHALDGFCIARGVALPEADSIAASALGDVIAQTPVAIWPPRDDGR